MGDRDRVAEIADLVRVAGELPRSRAVSEVLGTAAQIQALIALGILERVMTGGAPRIAWIADETESSAARKLVALEELARAPSTTPAPDAGQAAALVALGLRSATEEFELDVAADYEHERLLMYRVIIALEIVAAVVLVREITFGLH